MQISMFWRGFPRQWRTYGVTYSIVLQAGG